MLDKAVYGVAVVGITAIESYIFHPKHKLLHNMTRLQLVGKESTLPFRQKMWQKIPVAFSLSSLVFCMVYPPHGYTVMEKVGLLAIVTCVRIILSGKIYMPMFMKPAWKKIRNISIPNPFNPGPFKPTEKEIDAKIEEKKMKEAELKAKADKERTLLIRSAVEACLLPATQLDRTEGVQSPDKLN